MPGVIDYLRRFNRKERFYLIGRALGNPNFRLDDDFRRELSELFGLSIPVDAFVAMDYHLNWIYASLYLATHGETERSISNLGGIIEGNQEDIDLLVAYQEVNVCQIILLEAKADGPWSDTQLRSKAGRLGRIFAGKTVALPHFGFVSPNPPRNSEKEAWPDWMVRDAGKHIGLVLPADLMWVYRSDEKGKRMSTGGYWTWDHKSVMGKVALPDD